MIGNRLVLLCAALIVFTARSATAFSPSVVDDFANGEEESWVAQSPAIAQSIAVCLSDAGESCLRTQSEDTAAFLITNNGQWAGNWRLAGATQIALKIGAVSGPDIFVRLGIASDLDEDGPLLPACFVSDAQLVAGGSGSYTPLTFTLASMVQVTSDPACLPDTVDFTQRGLQSVTELRLFSVSGPPGSPPTWTPGSLAGPWSVDLDNVRLVSRSQIAWRYLGFRASGVPDCPPTDDMDPICEVWTAGFHFGDPTDPDGSSADNAALPGSLAQWCVYEYPPDMNALTAAYCIEDLMKDSLFHTIAPDFLGATHGQPAGRSGDVCVTPAQQQTDTDGDGCADTTDNCTYAPNPGQRDTDDDRLGNACDADFNQDCIVNAVDLGYIRSVFFTADADADLNGDGVVNTVDLGLFKSLFFQPPGPSGQLDGCATQPVRADVISGVFGAGDDDPDTLHDVLVEHFEGQAGRPLAPMPRAGVNSPTRLTVIDTQPRSLAESVPRRSPHGITLLQMAHQMVCDAGTDQFDPNCVLDLSAYPALDVINTDEIDTTRKTSQRDPDNGGYVGLVGEVGRAVWKETQSWLDWQAKGNSGPLVINLSIGWDPAFGGDQTSWRAMPVSVQTVFAAIEDARCRGALVVAAGGNINYGPLDRSGPVYPAGWQRRAAVNDRCPAGTSVSVAPPEPLVFAAGGVRVNGDPLFNIRPTDLDKMPGSPPLSEPPLAVFSDHGGVQPWLETGVAGFPAGRESMGAILTGSSIAALVTSTAAATIWHYFPGLEETQVVDLVYASGVDLGRDATVWLGTGPPPVKRIDLCAAVQSACGAGGCPALPSCPPATSLDPGTIDALLADFTDAGTTVSLPTTYVPVTSPVCAGVDLRFEAAPDSGYDFARACPNRTRFGTNAKGGSGPQPDDDFCPTCVQNHMSPGTLYVQLSPFVEPTLSDPVLRCGNEYFVLPVTTELTPGSRFTFENVSMNCATASPLWLMFSGDRSDASGPVGEETELVFVSQILRVPP